MSRPRKKLDLAGQQYGWLLVLAPAGNVDGRTAWRCRCICGKETVVKTYHLRSGHTTSCGCRKPGGIPGKPLPGLTYIDGTCVEMLRAKTVRRNNTSGVPGVEWRAAQKLWRATICFQGRRYYLGSYKRFEDAAAARKQAETELHDKFLREFANGTVPSRSPADSYDEHGKEEPDGAGEPKGPCDPPPGALTAAV